MPLRIRVADPSKDAPGVTAIYRPVVLETPISFELSPPTVKEIQKRMVATLRTHPWLVCVEPDDRVAGYAYATRFRARPAYRWSTEISTYVDRTHRRRGVARALYSALLDTLRAQGFVRALAGIALPNEASVKLHEALGFEPAGVFERVGFKLDGWHDVGWWQVSLWTGLSAPEPPVPFELFRESGSMATILGDATAMVS